MATEKKKKTSPLVPILSGCLSGGIECISVWPMEYIKTQLQLQKVATVGGPKPPYTGMISGLVYTVKTTGFFSLYKGLSVTLVGSIPKSGIRFGGNAYCKRLLEDKDGKLTMAKNFLAGMGAGCIEAVFAVTPMETIKTKLIQSNQALLPGIRQIYLQDGLSGFYQGTFATVLKQSSNQGLRFMFFNKYKDVLTDNGRTKMHPLTSLVGGMLAGCFSVLGNNPFDVVKTQMQGKDAAQYKNTVDCFLRIAREEGLRGLYKGSLPRMGRVVPGQGIIFMSFETIEEFVAKLF